MFPVVALVIWVVKKNDFLGRHDGLISRLDVDSVFKDLWMSQDYRSLG